MQPQNEPSVKPADASETKVDEKPPVSYQVSERPITIWGRFKLGESAGGVAAAAGGTLMVAGLFAAVILAGQSQDIRQRAWSGGRVSRTPIKPRALPTPDPRRIDETWEYVVPPAGMMSVAKTKEVIAAKRSAVAAPTDVSVVQKVLNIVYEDEPQDPNATAQNLADLLELSLEEASIYRGWNGSGTPQVDVQQVGMETIVGDPPVGGLPWPEADMNQVIDDNNLCNRLNAGEFDEVWLWGDSDGGLAEALMAGPLDQTIWTNGPEIERNDCNRGMHIMGYNYRYVCDYNPDRVEWHCPSPYAALHSFGHRVENVIAHYLDGEERGSVLPGDNWFEYDGNVGYGGTNYANSYCGNAHWPPNAITMEEYDYTDESVFVDSDCNAWNQQHTGSTVNNNCELWGCWGEYFFVWWMQNMPGNCNTMTKTGGGQMPNWWQLIFANDPTAPACVGPTPTPTPTPQYGCGNGICEPGEADVYDPGGCGPSSPPFCLGEPPHIDPGTCPDDCKGS